MSYRVAYSVICTGLLLLASSCSTLIAAYLINELLNDSAPRRTWSGSVSDTSGQPVGGVTVKVLAEVEGDDNIAVYDDETNVDGKYSIRFSWARQVEFTVRVVHEGVVFSELYFGKIDLDNQVTDFVIQSAISTELSGVVYDFNGDPVEGALVIGASASSLGATPKVLLNQSGDTQYEVTNESGVFQLEGSVARYGIACAYHPDHGFAYSSGEDDDSDGSIALNIDMGAAGSYRIRVQVLDGTGAPIPQQVLPPARQFRLRLHAPFNLGGAIDDLVSDVGLFPGLVGNPSDSHPATVTITVQATGTGGFAEDEPMVDGGNYELSLLNVEDDDPATALVTSSNPLVLFQNTTVVVRVN
ncbi:carboxypeptidase regulatory-like domain-containing protein [bacterium]|nr:carboxypeptidase regulatory-like domain-containing protein [bacterium]